MTSSNTDTKALGNQIVLGLFGMHEGADAAVRQLAAAGIALPAISIIGKNYHSEEQAAGFVNVGERAWYFGRYGAFWGGLAGLLVGSGFFFVPVVGSLVVLGPLASMLVGGIEGAVLAGGASALVGALTGLGIPRNSVVRYEEALKADAFLVSVHCTEDEVSRVQQLLAEAGGTEVQSHGLAGAQA
ncbi:MAG TPA: DUF1269 domain-containing protein [Acidovorax sp.]|jgi:hypothetical protein|nr:DUF1269 domain-containing protein [Acidovorax sp.]